MRFILCTLVVLLFSIPALGQEQFGINSSNYAPSNTLFLNPASIAGSGAYRDINVLGLNLFADNDLIFLSKTDFKLTRGASQFEDSTPLPVQNDGRFDKHGYADVMLQGPSFTGVFGRWALGFHTAARTVVDFRGISPELGNFMFEGIGYEPQQDIVHQEEDVRVGGMAWVEAGLTLGRVIVQSGNHMLSAAVTPRKLFGIAAAAARVDDLTFQVGDSAFFDLENLSARGGYAMPGWNNGGGWALNVGLSYKRMKESVSNYNPFSRQSGCDMPEYRYKVGLSILDLGSMRFKRDVQFYEIDALALNAANYNEDLPESSEELDSLLNADIGSHITDQGTMRMALPTALSLQFDWNIGYNFYASATWVHGFARRNKLGVQRAGVVNITPRFETRRFEVALPVTLYQYKYPRMGLAFRFNNVVIGTDRLGPLLFNPDVYGMDLYVSLKYTIFKSKHCKNRKVKAAKVGESKIVSCPRWD